MPGQIAQSHHSQYFNHSGKYGRLSNGSEFFKTKFKAKGKEQKNHTDLCPGLNIGGIG